MTKSILLDPETDKLIRRFDEELKQIKKQNELMKQDLKKLWQEYIRLTKDDIK
jgi:inactivated superfamily I helicase